MEHLKDYYQLGTDEYGADVWCFGGECAGDIIARYEMHYEDRYHGGLSWPIRVGTLNGLYEEIVQHESKYHKE